MTPLADSQTPKLLDQMRAILRTQRYAIRTEKAYCDWVRRYVKFHGMRSRADLADGTRKVEAFLTHLAVAGEVSPSTQNQALNALLFLYEQVLELPLVFVAMICSMTCAQVRAVKAGSPCCKYTWAICRFMEG